MPPLVIEGTLQATLQQARWRRYPKLATYSRMLLVGVPEAAVFAKLTREQEDWSAVVEGEAATGTSHGADLHSAPTTPHGCEGGGISTVRSGATGEVVTAATMNERSEDPRPSRLAPWPKQEGSAHHAAVGRDGLDCTLLALLKQHSPELDKCVGMFLRTTPAVWQPFTPLLPLCTLNFMDRYARMLAVGVPEAAVLVKMRGDGVEVPAPPQAAPEPSAASCAPAPAPPASLASLLKLHSPELDKYVMLS